MMKTIAIEQTPILAKTKREEERFRPYSDPLIEVVIPVLNEEATLKQNVLKLQHFLNNKLPYRFRITVADNGSTDSTAIIAKHLAAESQQIRLVKLSKRGRGRALKYVWMNSEADILTYMDVDLSTDLNDFLPMIQPLIEGRAGVGIGSRLAKGARVKRGFKRDFISKTYNKIIKFSSKTKFSDAQCGFKAIRRDVARQILPKVKDNEWFFDTELLIKAEHANIKIHERPVKWDEDTDSRVKIVKTAVDDLKGLRRVNKELQAENGEKSPFEKWFLPVILLATGALYLFGASQNGMANSYYAAAVQAASQDWTAWLFGSLDSANYVSVDKPPMATMIMGLSARIFGFSNFSMTLPNVLVGVGTLWLVYLAVKRFFGFKSAAIAASVFALTPVVALMSGFNNPDAILMFFLAASGYAFLRSLDGKKPIGWLILAGVLTGFAFNTKMLQGLMVLPAMAITYFFFAKPKFFKRIFHLVVLGISAVISSMWWSVLVWLTPAENRPWVGSTNDNSIWSLILGYNGFGRLLGGGAGQGGGGGGHGPGGTGFGGQTGILRIFNNDFGPNIAWVLAIALVATGIFIWAFRQVKRANLARAVVVFWAIWLIVHIIIFSMTSGVIHPYYVVVMAPAVASLIGITIPFAIEAYKRRKRYAILLPIGLLINLGAAITILNYSGTFAWLNWLMIVLGGAAILTLMVNLFIRLSWRKVMTALTVSGAVAVAPMAVYTIATVNVAHSGSIPTSGAVHTAMAGSNNEQSQAEEALAKYLLENQDGATWIVAVNSANESAAIQLSTNQPVMALGGFNGSDTPLTLDDFKELVRAGKIKYYAASSQGHGGGMMGGNSEIVQWIQQNAKTVNYGGSHVTLYQLSV